jgi:hypothetical protein
MGRELTTRYNLLRLALIFRAGVRFRFQVHAPDVRLACFARPRTYS